MVLISRSFNSFLFHSIICNYMKKALERSIFTGGLCYVFVLRLSQRATSLQRSPLTRASPHSVAEALA